MTATHKRDNLYYVVPESLGVDKAKLRKIARQMTLSDIKGFTFEVEKLKAFQLKVRRIQ